MFTFDFNVDEDERDSSTPVPPDAHARGRSSPKQEHDEAAEVHLEQLVRLLAQALPVQCPNALQLSTLPSKISYSPASIHLDSSKMLVLPRRDLFDARFQLMEADDEQKLLPFLDAPSDLVRGVYEGGLKTWECSLDVVGYLESNPEWDDGIGEFSAVEIGCGTALPSCYAFQKVLTRTDCTNRVSLCLQDYNRAVLELVTLPNLLLAWYFSPDGMQHRSSDAEEDNAQEARQHGDLELTEELLSAFRASLVRRNLRLRFFCGSWTSLLTKLPDFGLDEKQATLVITSETVYHTESLEPLVQVLKAVSFGRSAGKAKATNRCLTLVAAKLIYFGVGGGVQELESVVESSGGRTETIWETRRGIARSILKLEWV